LVHGRADGGADYEPTERTAGTPLRPHHANDRTRPVFTVWEQAGPPAAERTERPERVRRGHPIRFFFYKLT
jgi:hypothetical protein